jgi:hypothetical protein
VLICGPNFRVFLQVRGSTSRFAVEAAAADTVIPYSWNSLFSEQYPYMTSYTGCEQVRCGFDISKIMKLDVVTLKLSENNRSRIADTEIGYSNIQNRSWAGPIVSRDGV